MEPTRSPAQSRRSAPWHPAPSCMLPHGMVRHASSLEGAPAVLSPLSATRPQEGPTLPSQHTSLESIQVPQSSHGGRLLFKQRCQFE